MRHLWTALICTVAAGTLLARQPTQQELDKQFLSAWDQQTRQDLHVPAAGTKLVVVKFNDWMCPGCKFAHQAFKPILAKYRAMPGVLKYVERDWPWNKDCNSATQQTFLGHEASCDAAAAVRLAADRGKRDEMVEWLFANQPGEDAALRASMPGRVRARAMEMLALKDFSAGYAAKLPEVRKDVAEGVAVNIRSTPTYFVNGIRAVNADQSTIPAHYFELALQHEYQRNGGK